jgi:replicative DNA helicase
VLGAMLIAPGAIDRAVEAGLEPAHFYRESHGRIYRAALALHSLGQPVDAITMTARLEETGELDSVGGRVRLYELAKLVPATANTGHWARIIVNQAILRGIIHAGGAIAQLGWAGEGEVPELIAEAERLMNEVAEAGDANDAAPLNADLAEIGLDVKEPASREWRTRAG